MALVVAGLHIVGIGTLVLVLSALHHGAGRAGTLTVGVALTAYVLGLRHAFDADHIAAIDNSSRRLAREREAPVSVGLWFSLGHSTVVLALAGALAFGVHGLGGQVENPGSQLHAAAGWVGTLASGGFLYLIAAFNIAILVGIYGTLRRVRRGDYDEAALERQLEMRGVMNRLLARVTRRVTRPSQMYPVGLLFGLGFDTATEIALLVLAAGAIGAGLPWYGVLSLPLLFAAGMSLLDSLDGWLMSNAYGWALDTPVRKVFYNLAVTALSVAVAVLIGTIELGGLAASKLHLAGGFWAWLENVNMNTLGFAIAGLFVGAWLVGLAAWRFGRIEDRWGARLEPRSGAIGVASRGSGS